VKEKCRDGGLTDLTATLHPLTAEKNAETIDLHTLPTLHTQSLRNAEISPEMSGDCIEKKSLSGVSESKVCKSRLTPTSEPDANGCKVGKVSKVDKDSKFKVGDRVKITPDYPGSKTLIGVEGTVTEDLGKRGLDIEFDAEIEIVGGKPKKFLVVSAEFLAVIPVTPVPTKKAPTKIKVGDRVVIKDVGGRYAGTRGTVTKVFGDNSYYIDYDKAVGISKTGQWPASELWKLPN